MSDLSLRSKLALVSISVCITTFGVGGYLVTDTAREVLATEVSQRLEYQALAYSSALDTHMSMLNGRVQDFASDGFLRSQTELLLDGGEDAEATRARIEEHLSTNKLPLEVAFRDLAIVAEDGSALARANPATDWTPQNSSDTSNFIASDQEDETPYIEIGAKLYSLDRTRHLGSIVARVHSGIWIADALNGAAGSTEEQLETARLYIIDRTGQRLLIEPSLDSSGGQSDATNQVRSGFGLRLTPAMERTTPSTNRTFERQLPIESNGWTVSVELRGDAIQSAISGLQSRLMGIGIALSLAAWALFLLPMGFVTRPLQTLQLAARSIAAGNLSSRVVMDAGGELAELGQAFNVMAQAVEERDKRHELGAEELREQQIQLGLERDRLKAVITSMRDGLVVLDGNGKVIVHNAAAGPLLSALRKEELQLTSRHTCTTGSSTPNACHQCLFSTEIDSRSCVLELASGTYEIHATQFAVEMGGPHGRVLVSRDISDRVLQDDRMIHQERLAVLGEIAAVMAHELNNPLASISLYNQMLATEFAEVPSALENVEVIQRNVDACKQTIRELLDYATVGAPERTSCDVNAVIEDGAGFLRLLKERSDVEISLDLTDEELEVRVDEIQLRQIFVNLIVNAIQATKGREGHIRVVSRLEEGYAVIDVHDNGCGISPDLQQRIFKPFFTTKERGEGTGLGLPTAQRITEMHGGALELVSSSPTGSHFRVRLLLHRTRVS
jgi:signal transduction histidine kinase